MELRLTRDLDYKACLLLVAGAGLRILQYVVKSSFWGDELAVIANVTSRGTLDLVTRPLTSGQMAPSGFLLGLKLVIGLAGANEYSLRFIPLLSALLALPLFASFSRRVLPRPAMLLALGAFALSPPLIRYAAQVKPYSSDVAICLVCLMAAHAWMAVESSRNVMWLGVAGAAAIWFSYPAMCVLASIGLVVVVRCAVQWSTRRGQEAGVVLAIWTISAGVLALVERHRASLGTRSFMLAFWANWLMPLDMNWQSVSSYLVRIARDCLSSFLYLPKWPVFFVLLVIGLVYLVRRNQGSGLIVVPIGLVLAASMLRIYPFSGRMILFLVPNIYMLLAAGIEATVSLALRFGTLQKWRTPLLGAAFSGAAIIMCFRPLWNAHPPFHNSETRPVIFYLGEHHRDGDAIYVHGMAWRAYSFYGPNSGLRIDEATETSSGEIPGPKPLVILKDLDQFRGRSRVWVLFGGGYPVEASCPLLYLDSIGRRLDRQTAFDASVYLYDLSDRGHLKHAGAEEFFSHSRSESACAYDATNPIGPQK